jgi:RNA polymerase sigma-70 factor (ECF subfamily)
MISSLTWKGRMIGEGADTPDVIRQAKAGDLEAFEVLVRRHERRVLKLAYQMVGNLDDAQDVAQEVYLRLWKYLGKIRDEAKFSTWLHRMVVNSSYDFLNRRRAHPDQVPLAEQEHQVADERQIPLDRLAVSADLRAHVMRALERLTPSERTVFVLRDIDGLDVKEIAEIHESSRVTVRRHLSNARHKLRVVLAGFGTGVDRRAEAEDPEETEHA